MEPTVTDLQAQIDRLSLAVHRGRETHSHVEPVARRLAELTDRCADIVNRWAETGTRHAQAVNEVEARLNEWGAIESRLEHDAVQRLRELQGAIEQEWKALRDMQEEPVRELREHAAALGELCVTATHVATQGFERAEARLVALEASIHDEIGQLSRDLRHALAETGRETGRQAPLGNVEPFPIEGVLRIHDELRQGGRATARADVAPAPMGPREIDISRQLPEAAASLAARIDSLEREITEEKQHGHDTATRADRLRRDWRTISVVLGSITVIIVGLGIWMWRELDGRLDTADARVVAAEHQTAAISEDASRQIAASRAEAERQIAEARDAAQKASAVSSILASPDLVRLNLVSADGTDRGSVQILWSRTRGLVLGASRLPAPPAGSTYQGWLLTAGDPVSAGVFVPDASGSVTLTIDRPLAIPRPVTGASVTIEPAGGQTTPSAPVLLTRPKQP